MLCIYMYLYCMIFALQNKMLETDNNLDFLHNS
nr:MAG TPA: hypothetical protein [Caudoviricetes sp.]